MNKTKRFLLFVLLLFLTLFYGRHAILQIYPLTFYQTVAKECEPYQTDPLFMMALIKTESNFREDATSDKQARGLMQLRDETAQWCVKEMGLGSIDQLQLYQPEWNIKIGVWYYHYLLNHFEGHQNTALAAYNAGMGNVKKWLQNEQYSKDGKTLSAIPYKETERYVNKVNYHHKIYGFLYQTAFKRAYQALIQP